MKKITPLPRWDQSPCRSMDPDTFFMDSDDRAETPNPAALAACNRCTITVECLHWAMTVNEQYGIWGGTTPKQRMKLRRPIVRIHCPGCGSEAILEEPTTETCLSCGLSWRI